MEVEEIRIKIIDVAKKRAEARGFELGEEICLIHLMEELGELAKQIYNKKARPEKYDEENLKEEICDVILESMILSGLMGMDLEEKLNEKIGILNKRLEKYEK